MDDKERNIARGHRAAELLGNELFKEAVSAVRDGLFNGWASTGPEEQDARDAYYIGLDMLERIERALQAVVNRGKFEADALKREKAERPDA